MGLLQTLYINSGSFITATAVFSDQALTTLAPDGFYSFGGYAREQVSGVLQQVTLCEACNPDCGSDLIHTISNEPGEYEYEVYLGDDIGAVRIEVNTLGGAAGFSVNYSGTTYNTIDTRNLGVLETTSGNGVTYIGDSSTFTTSGQTVPNYSYGNGVWTEGTPLTINPFAGGNLTNSVYHGGGIIVFPKLSTTANTATVKIRAPFADSLASIRVSCSQILPSFDSSQAPETEANACDAEPSGLYYASVVTGLVIPSGEAYVGMGDRVYNDPFGITPVSDGWFGLTVGAMEVTDGIITDISDCAA